MHFPIKKVIVEQGADDYRLTGVVLENLHKSGAGTSGEEMTAGQQDMPQDMEKDTVRLIDFMGEFLKRCPGTKEYICCGYQILNVGTNCPMDCSYCILQTYFNKPSLRIFANLERELEIIGALIDSNPGRIFRIGTGEFTDSLALDPVTGWSGLLTEFFTKKKNAVLELKTKTDNIEGLLRSPNRDRIIVSWSLNSSVISTREEHGAASIKRRLEAARRCQEEGFALGFHLDPLLHYEGWKDDYIRTIELLDSYIKPKGVIWISTGCFRYIPSLKPIIRRRHPDTHILDGEFINGLDGKMRYFKPIRIEMYSFIRDWLEKWHKDPGLYLCMESDDIWKKSMGWSPGDSDGLSDYLDKRVTKIFPGD